MNVIINLVFECVTVLTGMYSKLNPLVVSRSKKASLFLKQTLLNYGYVHCKSMSNYYRRSTDEMWMEDRINIQNIKLIFYLTKKYHRSSKSLLVCFSPSKRSPSDQASFYIFPSFGYFRAKLFPFRPECDFFHQSPGKHRKKKDFLKEFFFFSKRRSLSSLSSELTLTYLSNWSTFSISCFSKCSILMSYQ